MRAWRAWLERFFGSLPGLLVVVVAWEALLVASLAPFSGPLRPLGLADLLNLDLTVPFFEAGIALSLLAVALLTATAIAGRLQNEPIDEKSPPLT